MVKGKGNTEEIRILRGGNAGQVANSVHYRYLKVEVLAGKDIGLLLSSHSPQQWNLAVL